jgi:UDP-glucose 4-epimerase
VEQVEGDLCEISTWENLPDTVTHVFHLAAVIPWTCAQRAQRSVLADNLLPTARLLERSRGWPGLKQVILSSSVSVYPAGLASLTEDTPVRPEGLYGLAKLAGEELLATLRSAGIAVACLRYSSLYGPGQYAGTVLPTFVRNALGDGQIHVFGTGRRVQDFLHHADAARAALLALRRCADGVYNVGSGQPTSMAELARVVVDVFTGGTGQIIYHPEQPESPGYTVDISKAIGELGFRPAAELRKGLTWLWREMEARAA